MLERVEKIESRLKKVENALQERNFPDTPSHYENRLGEASRKTKGDKDALQNTPHLTWVFVEPHEITNDLVLNILQLYVGKNFASFESYIRGQAPFFVHLLGNGGNVSEIYAAIIVKNHSCGKKQIKLCIHKNRQFLGEIVEKYVSLLQNGHFAELSGALEVEIRNRTENVKDVSVITSVAQVSPSSIFGENDARRKIHTLPDGTDSPSGSYIVASTGKRLAMYGSFV